MEYAVLFGLLFALFPSFHGFLLDDKTTSVPILNHAITLKEFNDLVILVSSERTARLRLEQKVIQLENELQQTEKGLTDVYHDNQRHNASVTDQNIQIASLVSANAAIISKYDALEHLNQELRFNLTKTETELNNVKNKVNQLEQWKAVTDLQLVRNLQNETQHLQDELIVTNSKLDRVWNETNARKDDIISLYNTVNNSESKFISYAKNTSEVINRTRHDIVKKLSKNISDLSQHQKQTVEQLTQKIDDLRHNQNQTTDQLTQKISDLSQYQNQTAEQLTQKIAHLDYLHNVTSHRIDRELHNMSGRAVLTSCASQNTYTGGSKILFPYVKTRYGVGDSVISELGTARNYRVESSGIYLVSAYFTTPATGYFRVDVLLYNRVILYGYFYSGNQYQTSTVISLERLERGDIINIKVSHDMFINGSENSCLTLLQLTAD